MGFVENTLNRFGYGKVRYRVNQKLSVINALWDFAIDKRGYSAAKENRLTADWISTGSSANEEIRNAIKSVRTRARDLYNNNDYAKKYIRLCQSNIVGPHGVRLQMKIKNARGDQEVLDKQANDKIESAWSEWSKKENCSVNGKLSLRAVEDLLITHVARDGDVFIRKIKGKSVNDFGFALQIIEPDHVDETLNKNQLSRDNTNYIRMGIELNKWGKPVAYYIKKNAEQKATDYSANSLANYERVPASEVVHLFDPDRADQARGVSWMCQSMIHLKMLDGYEEASLINARVSAAKMGFFTSNTDDAPEYVGDSKETDTGSVITNVEPGKMEQLPAGLDFKPWDPQFPHDQHSEFLKRTLMGISSGLGVSYNNLANDLEGVNYSSIRSGLLEEREQWKRLQSWFIESFLNPVFSEWLSMALTTNMINLPDSKFDKFNAPVWMPRRWNWVDPLKDIQAHKEAVQLRVRSRKQIASEEGNDLDDILDDIAEEEQKLKDKNLFMQAEGNSNEQSSDTIEPDN